MGFSLGGRSRSVYLVLEVLELVKRRQYDSPVVADHVTGSFLDFAAPKAHLTDPLCIHVQAAQWQKQTMSIPPCETIVSIYRSGWR